MLCTFFFHIRLLAFASDADLLLRLLKRFLIFFGLVSRFVDRPVVAIGLQRGIDVCSCGLGYLPAFLAFTSSVALSASLISSLIY